MEEIKKIQDKIISEFEMFNDWVEKYEYLIDIMNWNCNLRLSKCNLQIVI